MYLVSTIVLLSTLWGMAQSAGQQSTYPNGTTVSNQSPDRLALVQASATQPSSAIKHDSLLEGCIGGSSDSLTLTDAVGKVYQLRGDTAKLADHVGQHASLTGSEEQGSASGAAGAPLTFTVKKVAMIARTCSASK
jgi:hypothetical protein